MPSLLLVYALLDCNAIHETSDAGNLLKPAMPKPRAAYVPVNGFVRPSLGFRYGK